MVGGVVRCEFILGQIQEIIAGRLPDKRKIPLGSPSGLERIRT